MSYLGAETEILHERYAGALFNAAKEIGNPEEVLGNLTSMTELVDKNKELGKILRHPEVEKTDKYKTLERIAGKERFSEVFLSFLKVLCKKDRLSFIHATFLKYRDLYNREKGKIKVFVRTAVTLSERQIERLEETLDRKLKMKTQITQIVRPSLIGGLDVKIGDRVYNLSLIDRLKLIKERLKER